MPESSGRVASVAGEVSLAWALTPVRKRPFAALAVGAEPAVAALSSRLLSAGALPGQESDLHAARILCGWPALGAEIDDRTLPQEVRYDQIGGVSYTKGCYTDRRPWRGCTSGVTPTVSCVACAGEDPSRWMAGPSIRASAKSGAFAPR